MSLISLDDALMEVADLEEQLKEARQWVVEAVSRSYLICQKCGEKTQIKGVTLLQTHWYEAPYSCTGGDKWHPGERKARCPKCKFTNRSHNDPRLSRQIEYPNAFLGIEKVY